MQRKTIESRGSFTKFKTCWLGVRFVADGDTRCGQGFGVFNRRRARTAQARNARPTRRRGRSASRDQPSDHIQGAQLHAAAVGLTERCGLACAG
jgi:hypothetical protein